MHPDSRGVTRAVLSVAVVVAVAIMATVLAPVSNQIADAQLADTPGTIYLIIGQSNAAGRGDLSAGLDSYPGVTVANSTGQFVDVTPNLNEYSTVRKDREGYNLGYSFGGAMHQVTGEEINLVVNARGGTSIDYWLPGEEDPDTGMKYYDEAVARTNDILAGTDSTLGGVIWHQGEADRNSGSYMADLEVLITALRADFDAPDLPFVAGELSNARDDNADFNATLPEIDDLGNSGYVRADGLTTADDLTHFTTEALRDLGDRYALKMLELQGYDMALVPTWVHPWSPDVLGDVTCDRVVDVGDALAIAQFSVNTRSASDTCPLADPTTQLNTALADVDDDGSVDLGDALLIAQCTVGLFNMVCPA